ncbi:MAG: ABC transporter ATP-binding protein [Deltaproteobacteria bacterium]|nr:MAG: ABC transporter ATP-binding protein [Deltaproteobacteria bacterium]
MVRPRGRGAARAGALGAGGAARVSPAESGDRHLRRHPRPGRCPLDLLVVDQGPDHRHAYLHLRGRRGGRREALRELASRGPVLPPAPDPPNVRALARGSGRRSRAEDAVIRVEDVSLSFGDDPLFEDVSWHLRPGEHLGLVGRNGTGKTTLLRILAEELTPDTGKVLKRGGIRVGWLPQHTVAASSRSVWDEASSQMDRLQQLKRELEEAQGAADAGEPGAAGRLAEATDAFTRAGGYRIDQMIGEVLHGLGFGPDTWHRPCDSFSGGWQMRVALARLLLSGPDVALLDEPTNHLDLPTRSWLANYLARAEFAFIVVSHDRHLLDHAVDGIAEVRHRQLSTYTGNFTRFLAERELRESQHEAAFAKQQDEIARLERFVERFGAKATKAAQARSRQKRLDKMDRLEAPRRETLPRYRLPEAPEGDHTAIKLVGASIGFDDGPDILAGVDFQLERGQRIALLGPNGCGKSTLLKAMAGQLRLRKGRRIPGGRLRLGVFDQDVASRLPEEMTPLAWLSAEAPLVPPERIRAVLGALGLSGGGALREIGELSGGERARVVLAGLSIRPHNCLLLDEPTNHLDAETVEVLVRALAGFEGAMLLVSHDRYVVEELATHVGLVRDGGVVLDQGVEPEHFDFQTPTAEKKQKSGGESYAEQKRLARERERLEKRVAQLEEEVAKAEERLEAAEAALHEVGHDFEKAAEAESHRQAMESELERLMSEWEEASLSL